MSDFPVAIVNGDAGHLSHHELLATLFDQQFTQGALASRPAAGVARRTFFATDTGQWFRDDGSAWHEIVMVERAAINDPAMWVDVRAKGADPTGSTASDSAFAAAKTSVGAGTIFAGQGTFKTTSTFSLTVPGSSIRGTGPRSTIINVAANLAWGFRIFDAENCSISDVTIQTSSTVTNLCGATTSIGGEVLYAHFSRVRTFVTAGGVVTNMFALGTDNPGQVKSIGGTTFIACSASAYLADPYGTAFKFGDGTTNGVLGVFCFGSDCAGAGQFGVVGAGCGFTWIGGAVGQHTQFDFFCKSAPPAGDPFVVQGVRSELSAALWGTDSPLGGACIVSFRDVVYFGNNIRSDGFWIDHALGGTLVLDNVGCYNSGGVAPKVYLNETGQKICLRARGLKQAAEYRLAVTVGAGSPDVCLDGYTQLDSGGGTVVKIGSLTAIGAIGAPAFENTWSNLGGFDGAAFWKDASGVVHLRGVVTGGTMSQPVFHLPVGFRPPGSQIFGTVSNGAIGRIDIAAGGDVVPVVGNNAWVALNGISFLAAL